MKQLLILFFISVFISYGKPNSEDLQKDRQTSVLELRQLVNKTEVNKQTYGVFFFIGGSINSTESTEVYVKVFAKVDGYFRVVSIPIHKLRVNIDNTLEKPNLVIKYYNSKRTDSWVVQQYWQQEECIINCPEKYLPEKLLPIEL